MTVVPELKVTIDIYLLSTYFITLNLKYWDIKKGRIFFTFSFENWDFYLSYRGSVID